MKIVMMGATGAVGSEVVNTLLEIPELDQLTLLGRRDLEGVKSPKLQQYHIDIFDPETYSSLLDGHHTAICTLGVGQPSKMGKDQFLKIDKNAVYDFAKACKTANLSHFELLASVGIDSKSSSFYLRSKGELVESIDELNFERFSVFKPSMILTPTNRYGFTQGVTLAVWPVIDKLFFGGLKKYKGVKVSQLGEAMARNVFIENKGVEYFTWESFQRLSNS
ncbi:MAG: NAD(P)H-binding protein [Saprospiraceae bacterium]